MKQYEKKWKTIDLSLPISNLKKPRLNRQRNSSIHQVYLQQMIANRLNGNETKSIFFVKTKLQDINKKSESMTKQQNLPILSTVSKQLYRKKKKQSDGQQITLPLTTSFERALASYKSKKNTKQQIESNRRKSYFVNDYQRYNRIQFNKEQVLVGNRTTFYEKSFKKSKEVQKQKNSQYGWENKKGNHFRNIVGKAKINKLQHAGDKLIFSPWQIDNQELIM